MADIYALLAKYAKAPGSNMPNAGAPTTLSTLAGQVQQPSGSARPEAPPPPPKAPKAPEPKAPAPAAPKAPQAAQAPAAPQAPPAPQAPAAPQAPTHVQAQAPTQVPAQAQPQPQAQAPAQTSAQEAATPKRTVMQHVDAGLTRMRSAPGSAWAQLSPENQQYLTRGKQWAGRQVGRAARWGALGAGAYAGYRLLNDSSGSEQDARMRDYLANAQHQMAQPMPGMSVYASYDDFAEAKHAALKQAFTPSPYVIKTNDAFASAFGQSLAKKLVEEPIDNIHRFLKKKIVDDPKANDVFHTVISEDPMLAQSYKDNPKMLERSFAVMRKMSPSVSTLHGPVQSYLRLAMMSGGNLDPAAVKHLTDIQQAHSRAKSGM